MTNKTATIILFLAAILLAIRTFYLLFKFQRRIVEAKYDQAIVKQEKAKYFKNFILGVVCMLLLFAILGFIVNYFEG